MFARSPLTDHLKQIVYGGNDGIVTTFAIVAGFAGANAEGTGEIAALAVLVFGLANLFCGCDLDGLGRIPLGPRRPRHDEAETQAVETKIHRHRSTP